MSKVEPTPASGGATAWPEFWQAQLASHLAALFDSADPATLAELQADAEWGALRGGDILFRRGDPGNAAYTVLSGRLRVIDDTAGERALNEIGAGEILGEMALLSSARRSIISTVSGSRPSCGGSALSSSTGCGIRARPPGACDRWCGRSPSYPPARTPTRPSWRGGLPKRSPYAGARSTWMPGAWTARSGRGSHAARRRTRRPHGSSNG